MLRGETEGRANHPISKPYNPGIESLGTQMASFLRQHLPVGSRDLHAEPVHDSGLKTVSL